jgi:hypothetical protein
VVIHPARDLRRSMALSSRAQDDSNVRHLVP